MSAQERADRAAEADALCQQAFADAAGCGVHEAGPAGVALVAVGGFGRGELAPFSDLDVVLVHEDETPGVAELAAQLWYPFWDAGVKLDHAVRSDAEMVTAATADVRVALGLLDLRHLAGDPALTLRLRGEMLALWRRQARERLPELRQLMVQRHQVMGELAHASVPDLKEAAGGLRDATILKAIAATWLVDVPHADLERQRLGLLDVRDRLHAIAGRAGDRVAPEMWGPLAERLGLPDERAAQQHVRRIGRRITHLSRLTWRRVDAVLDRPRPSAPRRPVLQRLDAGVALSGGEIVLDGSVDPASDPVLFLRAAALAAEQDVVLAPPTVARLAATSAPLPTPWPAEARQWLVRLLAAGKGLLPVWETLDETGAIDRLMPEWERIRLLPHASVIHRFTVDRHVVETCVEASSLIRSVARPDVLMVAALLHDIGKGGLVEHSVAGAPLARAIAERVGFDAEAVDLIETLVRWHLLLSTTATTRDPDDPATVAAITAQITTPEALDLLLALTEADARATSPKAWSSWRATLIHDLARRAHSVLSGVASAPRAHSDLVEVPRALRKARGPGEVISMEIENLDGRERLTVIAPDRVGLLADITATLALGRVTVRAARIWAQPPYGISVWDLAETGADPSVLRSRYAAVREGRIDALSRLAPSGPTSLAPSVAIRPEASAEATVIEVRATDRPGIVYLVCAALARLEMTVRSAHVDTVGPQAVDVFYVQESHAGALSDTRAAQAAHAVRAALGGDAP